MSITPNSTGRAPPSVFHEHHMMMARVLETLWNKVQYIDHGINPTVLVDSEAIGWYRSFMRGEPNRIKKENE